ncbi:MAG: radical SAM protein, partial [Oscillospiraceae bacterium]|nr:radical SAM protein [Oscillospiraceae bacterium]
CPFDCVFCNQRYITGESRGITHDDVKNTIEKYLATLPQKDRVVETAFFGGSFTGIEPQRQRELLSAADEYVKKGSIDGIRLSTRPDYISKEALDLLSEYGVTTVELGVQSMDNYVLSASGRGHTAEDVENAVKIIRDYDFKLGLQMMTGLPGDTPQKSLETAEKIASLRPDFVRIYPTLVVKDTRLEELYAKGMYKPQSVDEAVALCAGIKKIFDGEKIKIIRISLVTTDEISPGGSLAAGPFHPAFGELVDNEIYYEKMIGLLSEKDDKKREYVFAVNPKDVSKAAGHKRRNTGRIYERLGLKIKIAGNDDIPEGDIVLQEIGNTTGG